MTENELRAQGPSRWTNNGLPRKGWTLHDVVDAVPNLDFVCEWCGTGIRYVHHIVHDEQKLTSRCGCICAENLTQDYFGHRSKEKALKKKAHLIKSWASSPRWTQTVNGNWRRQYKRTSLLVYKKDGGWKIKVGDQWSKRVYCDLKEAKLATLEVFGQIEDSHYDHPNL